MKRQIPTVLFKISATLSYISFLFLSANILQLKAEEIVEENDITIEKSIHSSDLSYILGSGDKLSIIFSDLEEYSNFYRISVDGNIYIPEIGEFLASGYSLSQLKVKLERAYKKYFYEPKLYLSIVEYKPVRVYVKGEVRRPGLYTIKGFQSEEENLKSLKPYDVSFDMLPNNSSNYIDNIKYGTNIYPTLFDAIKAAEGITLHSDLSSLSIIRKNSLPNGGGNIKASINFLKFIKDGDHSSNIRIFDGDTITIKRSEKKVNDQLFSSKHNNLVPEVIRVYISGNVVKVGALNVAQGVGLTQAIASAGGKKILSGKIEFMRFDDSGLVDRRTFAYDPLAKLNSTKNPILVNGDIINIRHSALGYASKAVGEVTKPVVGLYSIYNIYDKVTD